MRTKNGAFRASARFSNQGQTLVVLLVFMAIAVFITSAAVIVTLVNSTSSGKLVSGQVALDIAESGAENGLLRLLRDRNYTGEVLTVGAGTATISVVDGASPVVTSVGRNGNFSRTIEVTTSYVNNVLTVNTWREKL